jgi:site-specific DNA recombinase
MGARCGSRELWNKVHALLAENPRRRAANSRAQTPALLKGLIYGPDGRAMSPTHTRKGGRLYRYYVSQSVLKTLPGTHQIARVSAAEIERAIVLQLRAMFRAPEIIVGTWRRARSDLGGLSEWDVRAALERLDPLWDELFPAEQARVVRLLVDRIDLSADGAEIRLRSAGLHSLIADLQAVAPDQSEPPVKAALWRSGLRVSVRP